MAKTKRINKGTIPTNLIAPCGMNCRLCWGYIREKNWCPGCRIDSGHTSQKSKYRRKCIIKNCEQLAKSGNKYCSAKCDQFPCSRLKNLDKRYRTKYGMSMIDNLQMISSQGIRQFIRHEKKKWTCPKCSDLLCVHKPVCPRCSHNRNKTTESGI